MPLMLKLDVGASSYYSEIAAMQTMDNLLASGQIDIVQYLERIPDSYMPAKRALIEEKRQEKQMQQMMAGMIPPPGAGAPPPAAPDGEMLGQLAQKPEIPEGGGYSKLQRAVNSGADY
jgi:hypothetical protein